MQAKVALQSRLDICAMALAQERKKSLSALAKWNRPLRASIYGIYAARGLKIAGGPVGILLGGLSETALLQINRASAAAQNAILAAFSLKEASKMFCKKSPYSSEPAFCTSDPPLRQAVIREPTLFADVIGAEVAGKKTPLLASVRCRSRGNLTSEVSIFGDPLLSQLTYQDKYEK